MLSVKNVLKSTSGTRVCLFSTSSILRIATPSAHGLSYQVFGPEREDQIERNPVIFLHGLFGSKSNNRSVSRCDSKKKKRPTKLLTDGLLQSIGPQSEMSNLYFGMHAHMRQGTSKRGKSNSSFLFQDLRNHGQSFHAPEHNYSVMADDVKHFVLTKKLGKCVMMGHSMYVFNTRPLL